MKYGRQVQAALDRLDQSLRTLHTFVKNNKNKEAIHYMENGELKDRYDELQNIITIAQTGTLGARGTSQTGAL